MAHGMCHQRVALASPAWGLRIGFRLYPYRGREKACQRAPRAILEGILRARGLGELGFWAGEGARGGFLTAPLTNRTHFPDFGFVTGIPA